MKIRDKHFFLSKIKKISIREVIVNSLSNDKKEPLWQTLLRIIFEITDHFDVKICMRLFSNKRNYLNSYKSIQQVEWCNWFQNLVILVRQICKGSRLLESSYTRPTDFYRFKDDSAPKSELYDWFQQHARPDYYFTT